MSLYVRAQIASSDIILTSYRLEIPCGGMRTFLTRFFTRPVAASLENAMDQK
jgi:hypothetical protein